MADHIVARLEGEVSYSDGSSACFAAAVDEKGNFETDGTAAAFADALATVQGLFTALGGSLKATVTKSGKTVTDTVARMEILCTTPAGQFKFFAEYRVDSGTYVESGAKAAYTAAIGTYKTTLQNMIHAIAGVTITLT